MTCPTSSPTRIISNYDLSITLEFLQKFRRRIFKDKDLHIYNGRKE